MSLTWTVGLWAGGGGGGGGGVVFGVWEGEDPHGLWLTIC